jgi:IS30 family transposase
VGRSCRRLTIEERIEIKRLHKQGLPLHQIARAINRSWPSVRAVIEPTIATQERLWDPSPARLSMAEREEIRVGIVARETFTSIAQRLGRSVSTISREVSNHGGRAHYRAYRAHRRADAALGGPSQRSWRSIPPCGAKSKNGCSSCGHQRRSPSGCATSSQTIR